MRAPTSSRLVAAVTTACLVVAITYAGVSSASGGARLSAAVKEPAPSLFGLNAFTVDNSSRRIARDLPSAKKLGARWVHFTPSFVKFPHGKPNFSLLDGYVNRARSRGLGVLLSLGGIPAACSLHPRPADITKCPPTTSQDLSAYSSYLKKLLKHFSGRVDYYESWIEPNHAGFWPPKPNPSAYATLLKTDFQVFRATNPSDKLLFASIGETDYAYLNSAVGALGGQKAFDAVAYHAYRFPTTNPNTPNNAFSEPDGTHPKLTWKQELEAYEQTFTSHGFGQPPLWLTEFGWPGSKKHIACSPSSYSDQSGSLRTAYTILKQLSFAQAAFYFNIRDYGSSNGDPECFAHMGLLQVNFKKKPAARVFKHFAHGGS